MTTDLRDRLQSSLGNTYTLDRELGGGGMSRVFSATETALGRKVVVKVLPPELAAGVSTERFKREISVAARLQHPHIVSVCWRIRRSHICSAETSRLPAEQSRAVRTWTSHRSPPTSRSTGICTGFSTTRSSSSCSACR